NHYSPLSGLPDAPEHYHTVTITLSEDGAFTLLLLIQDNNPTEASRDHSQKNWEMILGKLKELLESEVVQRLFSEYENAFSRLDVGRSAEFFADTFLSAGPQGVVAQSKAEFIRLAGQAAEFYKAVGQTSARILSLEENRISDEYSLVKVHWGVTFRKTGDRLIEFDVSYLVQKTGPEPKIILFVAHQDEEKAMKELGLL
ncbi:MAG TPA: SRPBCC domain-containing protein, partial [Methanoregulaceae archaeon]|nr:SRPBCC domain-containing protein [Methanoregulaceae archaeon]